MPRPLTWIFPYYNSAGMLKVHIDNWRSLPEDLLRDLVVIIVDDGSPDAPALPVIQLNPVDGLDLRLYRVLKDIPWNNHGARNLGAMEAPDGWMFVSDVDHMLPESSVRGLMDLDACAKSFYTLQRVTAVKKEDGNLKYDLMTDAFGKPKPHPNTYMVTKKKYWDAGGYDEDYCGTYGGDGPFMRMLDKVATRHHLQDLILIRWTRDLVPDASQPPEYREKYRAMYRQRFDKKGKINDRDRRASGPIRFPWERQL